MDYVPMKGPLPGERYMPSSGTEGMCFQDQWCSRCARDAELSGTKHIDDCGEDDWCPIVAASYRDEAVEWRELDSGECVCLAFVEAGTEPPPPRCEHTSDMFGMPW